MREVAHFILINTIFAALHYKSAATALLDNAMQKTVHFPATLRGGVKIKAIKFHNVQFGN